MRIGRPRAGRNRTTRRHRRAPPPRLASAVPPHRGRACRRIARRRLLPPPAARALRRAFPAPPAAGSGASSRRLAVPSRQHPPQQRRPASLRDAREEVDVRVDGIDAERAPSQLQQQRRRAAAMPVCAGLWRVVSVQRALERSAAELWWLSCHRNFEQVDLQIGASLPVPRQHAVLHRAVSVPLQLRAEIFAVRGRDYAFGKVVRCGLAILPGHAGRARRAREPVDGRRAGRAHAFGGAPQVGYPACRGLVEKLVCAKPRCVRREYLFQPAQTLQRGADACRDMRGQRCTRAVQARQ
eukprot:6214162-Pleurochrysis_carterae.AAC.1